MGRLFKLAISVFTCALTVCSAAEVGQPSYYWDKTAVGHTAELLTLFCRGCRTVSAASPDVPLVAVLRDTLGDRNAENDRVTYVWLLTYGQPGLGKQLLSAVPFFYWRVGGSARANIGSNKPLLNLAAPQRSVFSDAARQILQFAALDPMTLPVRASSRAYRANEIDHERLHLEEAVSYLRSAPAAEDDSALTETQLHTVIARLQLRKRLLGGLVSERRAAEFGEDQGLEEARIRARNWELLRQCADKTGLVFEPIDLAGDKDQYAVLWYSPHQSSPAPGTPLAAVWKLLSIKNPYEDSRILAGRAISYERWFDAKGALVPFGGTGTQSRALVPLGVYSLTYPKLPLLLVDFRNNGHLRRHELTQRAINELTAGVIGVSHITNWYYYAGADAYNFYTSRHGAAVSSAARLDCYSQFRVALALDKNLDGDLRKEMQRRVDSLGVNPLEGSPEGEFQAAFVRYERLKAAADGSLLSALDKERRAELASFGLSQRAQFRDDLFHYLTFSKYTHRVRGSDNDLFELDASRRVQYNLNLLETMVQAGTDPEVAYQSSRIRLAVNELSDLMPAIQAAQIRTRAAQALERLRTLSGDAVLKHEFSLALDAIKGNGDAIRDEPMPAAGVSPGLGEALQ